MVTELKNPWAAVLATLATPWLLVGSTSVDLFLVNQGIFNHEVGVLLPLLAVTAVVWAIGLAAYLASLRYSHVRFSVWIYFALAPGFLLYGLAREKASFAVALAIILLFVLFAARRNPRLIVKSLAIFAVITVLADGLRFFAEYSAPYDRSADLLVPTEGADRPQIALPNIYHFVFDEYQTEMLLATLDKHLATDLAGFVFYPENTTAYGRTKMALPSVFLGQTYNPNTSQQHYQHAAFNSPRSFVYTLKKNGYTTTAITQVKLGPEMSLFDKVIYLNFLSPPLVDWEVFRDFWVYSKLPAFITQQVLGENTIKQIKEKNFSPKAWAVISANAFQRFTKHEHRLHGSGRYSYVHLLHPHVPYVLTENCRYSARRETTPVEQTKCANRLLVEFIEELKRLDRFTSSIIIVHGDHGARYRLQDGLLVRAQGELYGSQFSWARSRALLLIKPPGVDGTAPMVRSAIKSQLIDIAPTLFSYLHFPIAKHFEGLALHKKDADETARRRKRYYYFYDKQTPSEWTNEMQRFIIGHQEAIKDKVFVLKNNPKF